MAGHPLEGFVDGIPSTNEQGLGGHMKPPSRIYRLTAAIVALATYTVAQHGAGYAAEQSRQLFTEPILIKGSPTNIREFDVSWNDNSTQRYYLADRTNNAIDLVDSGTDTFLGFIGRGHYTGSRPCPAKRKDLVHCSGPNGVVTDDLGHVWSGDGDANIIEADATKPGTEIIRSIPTYGKGRIDEMAYDPIDRILMAENDGDSPPYVVFVSVTDGSVLGRYVYPKEQHGMEQPAWVRQTGWFYQNVPGEMNRIDVFDPHNLPNPIKSFAVKCTGRALELTLSGLTVGPSGRLMTACGISGGLGIDPRTGQIGDTIPKAADADQVWYDSGSHNYYFSSSKLAVVSGSEEKFITHINLPSHSVAVNAGNKHVFVPVFGKGIFVVAPKN
jgi:hypothetical protein